MAMIGEGDFRYESDGLASLQDDDWGTMLHDAAAGGRYIRG